MISLDRILSRLERVKRAGKGHSARCPAHDDRANSLSIADGDRGLLLKCHAGCEFDEIVGALGIQPSDLFREELSAATRGEKRQGGNQGAQKKTPHSGPHKQPEKARPKVVATYDYCDEDGALLFQALRLEPKSFRQRRPGDSGWIWSLGDVRRVLYRLPQLLSADPAEPVLIVEGEKDANRLARLGFVATTTPCGAGKWLPEFAESLRGRDVCILPDNDDPGRKHAQQIRASLVDVAEDVRIVELPDLEPKGDVSDWLDAGNTPAQLRELVRADAEFHGIELLDFERESRLEERRRVLRYNVAFLDDITRGLLPTDLIVIGAPTGSGKTTMGMLLASLAARKGRRVDYFALEAHKGEIHRRMLFREIADLAWQRELPGRHRLNYASWCVGECEEIERAVEADARRKLEQQLQTMRVFHRGRSFTADDIPRYFSKLEGKTSLIVFDHLHYVDSDDRDDNRAMKRAMKVLSDTALDMGTPVIAIAHLRKKDRYKPRLVPPIDDFHGAGDITKIATRVVMLQKAYDQDAPAPYQSPTYMQVQKDRLVGATSLIALCAFDLRKNSYVDAYTLGKLSADGQKFHELPAGRKPWWADRANCRGVPEDAQSQESTQTEVPF